MALLFCHCSKSHFGSNWAINRALMAISKKGNGTGNGTGNGMGNGMGSGNGKVIQYIK